MTKKNKQLLVEGNDDLHVMYALCQKRNIPQTFEIIDCKGIDQLIDSIPVRLKQAEINTMGIIVDADADINKRWNTISGILANIGYQIPDIIPTEGVILNESKKVKIGVWLMPDNNLNGMLEDFIKYLIPEEDQLLPIVNSTLTAIEAQKLNRYAPIHRPKALIHTWLAWQEDPGTPMGLSITKKYLNTDVYQCSLFLKWLLNLFDE
ncbi:DUF3226 domain-containing protein [Bacteroides sp. 51]|uniref:DUF3226 domain-containing protein n=1 Tax=Bacteroides sp. 51 TaxID=2302938 RepID=UPI0013D7462C|nr:DUF3226 domain-containing protein [Bacteroides sp. 51]NDV81056.1 hypothetical protein [Bacteroides sp. 51]